LRGERGEEVVELGDHLDVFVVGGVELLRLFVPTPCDDAMGRRAAAGAGSA
jgi:hypothetical protein